MQLSTSYAGCSEKLQRQDTEKYTEENAKKALGTDGICKQGGVFTSILNAHTDLGLNAEKQTQYLKND